MSTLFPSKMTILEDRYQSVNPMSTSSAESIRDVLPEAECVSMQKSYRSTVEITNLAQSVLYNPELIPIERHGDVPTLQRFSSRQREMDHLQQGISEFSERGFNSMGIICKTRKQATLLYNYLGARPGVRLIDAGSKTFSNGILIATAYLAKGLEFDEVVIPFCGESEYHSTIDRHMLYVAITRAMHRLTITYTGQVSPFLTAFAAG